MPTTSDKHAVLTGPIRGVVTLPDGTDVNVTDEVVYLDSIEQAHAVAHAIGEHYATEGHPHHRASDPFVHDTDRSKKNFAAAKRALKKETDQ